MNVQETLQILQALRTCGATHFKSNDFEVQMKGWAQFEQPISPQSGTDPAQNIVQVAPIENTEATEKLKDLIKTMSLPPEKLADIIFPNGAEG